MPPMANGGMQRGVYGRAESPYNADYLTRRVRLRLVERFRHRDGGELRAPSGSARRPGPAGRAPATNNGAVRLHPVARRHLGARQLAAGAHHGRGGAAHPHDGRHARGARRDRRRRRGHPRRLLARAAVGEIPRRRRCGPSPIRALGLRGFRRRRPLRGKRFGVPRMYVNADPEAGTGEHPGIGGATGQRIETRASIIDLLRTRPPRTSRRPAPRWCWWTSRWSPTTRATGRAPTIRTRGLVSAEYLRPRDHGSLGVGVGRLPRRQRRPGAATGSPTSTARAIFPHPDGALPDRYEGFDDDIADVSGASSGNTASTRSRDIPHWRRVCADSRRPAGSTSRSGWNGLAWTP